MSLTEKPTPRKHIDPSWEQNKIKAIVNAAKIGDQAFNAWLAGQSVFMDIVPGVQLHSIDGEIHEWNGKEWIEQFDYSQITESSTVQFNTGDDDLDVLMSFAIDISNELAGMQDHDNYKLALQRVLSRLAPT